VADLILRFLHSLEHDDRDLPVGSLLIRVVVRPLLRREPPQPVALLAGRRPRVRGEDVYVSPSCS
jgi:hypothetical protein